MTRSLFIFGRVFDFDWDFKASAEETVEYSAQLEVDWFAFWQAKGQELVNSSWSKKYSDYLLTDDGGDLERTTSNEENSEIVTDYKSWQELWDEHFTEIYRRTYELYSTVHYHQYCFYRPGFCEEQICEEPQADKLDILEQDEELLKALGLPTAFGGRNNKYHDSRVVDSCSDSLSDEEDMSPAQNEQTQNKPKKKKNNRKLRKIPKVIREDKTLRSYWQKRFTLFSRFDDGIRLDRESWFSVTPEKVALHMAERLRCGTIIDAFCGSGGNAIQFARTCSKVIAIDIDPEKIRNAQHNAAIYGVENKIDFIIGDYLQLCESLKGDVVFLSPPWGGPKYRTEKEYNIEDSLEPVGATVLAEKSRQISENIAFFLPKNSNPKQIAKLAGVGKRVEIEHNYLDIRLVGLTAIYGDWLIDKKNLDSK